MIVSVGGKDEPGWYLGPNDSGHLIQVDGEPRPMTFFEAEFRPMTYMEYLNHKPWTWVAASWLSVLVGGFVTGTTLFDGGMPLSWRIIMGILGAAVMVSFYVGAYLNWSGRWR